MHGSAQPDGPFPAENADDGITGADPPASGNSTAGQSLVEQELDAALQLLVERAQYITGATGAALALPSGDGMVCRASAGASAPPVGARLQVRSGLTGESIARRQLLRCDNAENDPRVNLETCRQMGIASIVVLPLLRRGGEVRGLFELFSDHAYAFEERDLSALERMADLTQTAMDLAEARPGALAGFVQATVAARGAMPPEVKAQTVEVVAPTSGVDVASDKKKGDQSQDQIPERGARQEPAEEKAQAPIPVPDSAAASSETSTAAFQTTPVPEAMRRVQKCAGCGFPVSEGRTYCLDCEKKEGKPSASSEPVPMEFVPSFLNTPAPPASWLADHVNLLAIVVLILGILVAIVVFR